MQGLKDNVLKKMRTTVSADKHRFVYKDLDLDLTYITDRIIAMSFPSEGFEATYRNSITDVSFMLSELHPGKYMVYNLTERSYDYTKFEKVIAWCGWPDHHSPPLITLLQLMKSIHTFLLLDPANVVLIHCLAGKGRTGTVIACYLLYCGLFSEGAHARNFFGYKRSNTNWGVVGPAQIRTVDYMGTLLKRGMPKWKPLRLKEIVMNKVPGLSLQAAGTGCTPVFTIHEYNLVKLPDPQPLIWTNEAHARTYFEGQEMISFFPENVIVMGDLEVTIKHWNWGRQDAIAVIAFNTAIETRDNPSLKVRFTRSDIDKANNDNRFPYDFWLEFIFEEVDPATPLTVKLDPKAAVDQSFWDTLLELPQKGGNNDGKIGFVHNDKLEEKLQEAQSFRTTRSELSTSGLGAAAASNVAFMNKGGWLTKLGHNVKTWKRRWFVLSPDKIEYFKKPNATHMGPLGVIKISDIETVLALGTSPSEYENPEDFHPNSFTIITKGVPYICYADNEAQFTDWLESITTTVQMWCHQQEARRQAAWGTMTITIIAAKNLEKQAITKYSLDAYATITYETTVRTVTCPDSLNPQWGQQEFLMYLFADMEPRITIQLYDEHFLGDSLIGTCVFNLEGFCRKKKPITVTKWYPLLKPQPDEVEQQILVSLQYFPHTLRISNPKDSKKKNLRESQAGSLRESTTSLRDSTRPTKEISNKGKEEETKEQPVITLEPAEHVPTHPPPITQPIQIAESQVPIAPLSAASSFAESVSPQTYQLAEQMAERDVKDAPQTFSPTSADLPNPAIQVEDEGSLTRVLSASDFFLMTSGPTRPATSAPGSPMRRHQEPESLSDSVRRSPKPPLPRRKNTPDEYSPTKDEL